MPKYSNLPILYNNALQINISKLREWGYLRLNQSKAGSLSWSKNGNQIASISIKISMFEGDEYLHLKYKFNDYPKESKIRLVRKSTNLGIGEMWFFRCPSTGKLCRKLYLIEGNFYHREAFKGCFYESQVQSKFGRFLDKNYGDYFNSESLYQQIHKKHLKKTYSGKPTKKYLKLSEKLERAQSHSATDIESLLIFGK